MITAIPELPGGCAMRRTPFATLLLITVTSFPALAPEASAHANGYSDCTCDASGRWQATDPDLHAAWADGSCEDHVNVRRCRELDEADPRARPCTPGDERSMYGDPA